MIPVLSDENGSIADMKQKSQNKKTLKDAVGDESRSFLGFSHKNLSVSHSDLEQGFNRPRFPLRRHDILSGTAILLALLCIGLEIWKLRCVMENAREIDILKEDVETLKHKLVEKNLLEDLKAFEEQFFANGFDDNDDDVDDDDDDYDLNYDDDLLPSQEFIPDFHVSSYSNQPSETAKVNSEDDLKETLAALHKMEADNGLDFEKKVQENHRNIEHDRLFEEDQNRKMRKHENAGKDNIVQESTTESAAKKVKRSITNERLVGYSPSGVPIYSGSYMENKPNFPRGKAASRLEFYSDLTKGRKATIESSEETPTVHHRMIAPWDRHPPKKYYAQTRPATAHALPNPRHNSRGSGSSQNHHRSAQNGKRRRLGWKEETPMSLTLDERRHMKDVEDMEVVLNDKVLPRNMLRGLPQRHTRGKKQVIAAHYGADSTLFSTEDVHTGNDKVLHDQGIFKAWRPSDWVSSLNMSQHFSLANGILTVSDSGLYLVYAQIHYLDEHDENGFHVLVNDHPIFQCMVYSPGTGHKSRSCFSAQLAMLQAGDRLMLKDVGSARYTLFQHDKSFFGLVKLGEQKTSKRQQDSPDQGQHE